MIYKENLNPRIFIFTLYSSSVVGQVTIMGIRCKINVSNLKLSTQKIIINAHD